MANSRATFGAVLSTITATAATVTTVLDTATAGVNMLAKFVDDAAEQQRIRSILDMDSFSEQAIEEAAMAEAERKNEILVFCKKSAEHESLFKAAYDRKAALLAPKK